MDTASYQAGHVDKLFGAAASTAVHNETDQGSSSVPLVGIAGCALHDSQHEANPYLACVREEHHPRRCCGQTRRTKLMLAAVATFIIVAGVALGLGLHYGLQKGKKGCEGMSQSHVDTALGLHASLMSHILVDNLAYFAPALSLLRLTGLDRTEILLLRD
jgi:hypothetical protein